MQTYNNSIAKHFTSRFWRIVTVTMTACWAPGALLTECPHTHTQQVLSGDSSTRQRQVTLVVYVEVNCLAPFTLPSVPALDQFTVLQLLNWGSQGLAAVI
jgi:hypothetical protein